MSRSLKPSNPPRYDGHWISVSDLMAGLMMVFLCIAIFMMRSMLDERDKVRKMAVSYRENQVAIYESLMAEFEKDLPRWGANIDRDSLTFSFSTPDSMFETGESVISEFYQNILSEFVPRYMKVLSPFHVSIEEVRLEGHTSSGWSQTQNAHEAYFKNLELSQDRTRSVFHYITTLENTALYHEWLQANMAAVGYSSSRPIINEQGHEDSEGSRRVAFRVITNSELKIKDIIEETL